MEDNNLLEEIYTEWETHKLINQKPYINLEDELRYRIICQRFTNLNSFLIILKKQYNLSEDDKNELLKLWFLYNDLKEIHFIGTDIYSDVMFVKHKVPYLYRSVGKDTKSGRDNIIIKSKEDKEKQTDIGTAIFNECLKQIESGGKGNLFSYSKSFGKMLIKYANIEQRSDKVCIELRKDAVVNCICDNSELRQYQSLQFFLHIIEQKDDMIEIPYFSVDMSNARANSVNNMKLWLDEYLGKQEYVKRFCDIYDPIGDVEVVCNYTGCNDMMCERADRYEFSKDDFCKLLYLYGLKCSEKLGEKYGRDRVKSFEDCITKTVETIPDGYGYKEYYEDIRRFSDINNITDDRIDQIINKKINWDNEIDYMSRQKVEKGDDGEMIVNIDIYKKKKAEHKSIIWKEIVFEAIRGKNVNYSTQENKR